MTVVVEGEPRNRKRARQGGREGAVDYRYAEKISTPSTFFSFFFCRVLRGHALVNFDETGVQFDHNCSLEKEMFHPPFFLFRFSLPCLPSDRSRAAVVPFSPSLVLSCPARIDQRRQTFPANLHVSPIPLKGERFERSEGGGFDE